MAQSTETGERSVVVAANRGPVTFETGASGERHARRGSGGLVTALRPVMEGGGSTWIASAMSEADHEFARSESGSQLVDVDGEQYRLFYLDIDHNDYEMAYNVISNGLLWTAAHGLFDSTRRPRIDRREHEAWAAYRRYNQAFADAMAGESGEIALIQDYHLYLAPGMLRERAAATKSAFFLHTPFPALETLSHLPEEWVTQILESLLSADLVGFHTSRWATRFSDACRAVLGAEIRGDSLNASGRTTKVGVFPLGPEPSTLRSEASSEEVDLAEAELPQIGDEQLILRVDRVEPAKNTVRGFWAIDELLASNPDLVGRIRHLALLHPSRSGLAEYRAYESECLSTAEIVNARWRRGDWEPITIDVADSYPRSLAALRRYDVLLVNSIADGMNLVAREGPIINERSGLIVLSTEAGAAEPLGDAALLINPFDISMTAEAIAAALAMEATERSERSALLAERAAADSPTSWLQGQLDAVS